MNRSPYFGRAIPFTAFLLATFYSIGLILDRPSWLHGSNWVWVRRVPVLSGYRLSALVGLALLALLVWHLVRRQQDWSRRQTFLLLTWAVIFTPLTQLTIAWQHRSQPLSLAFATVSSSGFYLDGVRLAEPTVYLQEHLENMPAYRDVHVRTQPPGWQLAFWGWSHGWGLVPQLADSVGQRLLRYDCLAPELQGLVPAQVAAATLQMSILLWSGLGALPFYLLGRCFLGNRLARLALIVYPFWPALLVFQGRFDVLYGMLALLALWLAQVMLTSGRQLAAVFFAILMAAGTWFSFGTLAIILLVNLILLAQVALNIVPRRSGIWRVIALNGALAAALLLLWGGLWIALGVNGPALFARSQEIHQTLRINYPVWPLFNLFDLAVFMGMVAFTGIWAAGVTAFRNWGRWRARDALVLGWFATLLLLNLSAQVRAETGRLWLFMMGPGLLVAAAGWDAWLRPGSQRRGWETAVFLALLSQAIITGYYLGGRAAPPSVPEITRRLPASIQTAKYELGDTIALRGYRLHQQEQDIHLTLFWQATDFPRADYSVFAHLVAAGQGVVAQDDGIPQLPTWCWIPGEVVADERVLPAQEATEIGVGLYDWRTGTRLPVTPAVPNNVIPLPLE